MKRMLKIYLAAGMMCVALAGNAQTDPHFSQYYAYPMWLNPGLTGAIDGDYRVTALYRQQWNGIANGFKTPGISADFRTGRNIGLGLNVMNQKAGDAYNNLGAYASFAYTGARFGKNQDKHLAIGISAGMISRRFDPSKFQTGEQWNPSTGFDPNDPNIDVLSKTSASAFDAGAGIIYYDAEPGKKANVFIGASAFHLTQ